MVYNEGFSINAIVILTPIKSYIPQKKKKSRPPPLYIYIYIYRMSIKSFPDYKHLLQETLCCTSVRRVSAVYYFPTRCCTSILGFGGSSVFGCNISKQVDWERWSDTLATTIVDITSLDFFLWGYIKDKVFLTPVPDITNLKARITDAFATITVDMLENTWREIDYRLDVLRATKGAHVEVY